MDGLTFRKVNFVSLPTVSSLKSRSGLAALVTLLSSTTPANMRRDVKHPSVRSFLSRLILDCGNNKRLDGIDPHSSLELQ